MHLTNFKTLIPNVLKNILLLQILEFFIVLLKYTIAKNISC